MRHQAEIPADQAAFDTPFMLPGERVECGAAKLFHARQQREQVPHHPCLGLFRAAAAVARPGDEGHDQMVRGPEARNKA